MERKIKVYYDYDELYPYYKFYNKDKGHYLKDYIEVSCKEYKEFEKAYKEFWDKYNKFKDKLK